MSNNSRAKITLEYLTGLAAALPVIPPHDDASADMLASVAKSLAELQDAILEAVEDDPDPQGRKLLLQYMLGQFFQSMPLTSLLQLAADYAADYATDLSNERNRHAPQL